MGELIKAKNLFIKRSMKTFLDKIEPMLSEVGKEILGRIKVNLDEQLRTQEGRDVIAVFIGLIKEELDEPGDHKQAD